MWWKIRVILWVSVWRSPELDINNRNQIYWLEKTKRFDHRLITATEFVYWIFAGKWLWIKYFQYESLCWKKCIMKFAQDINASWLFLFSDVIVTSFTHPTDQTFFVHNIRIITFTYPYKMRCAYFFFHQKW